MITKLLQNISLSVSYYVLAVIYIVTGRNCVLLALCMQQLYSSNDFVLRGLMNSCTTTSYLCTTQK